MIPDIYRGISFEGKDKGDLLEERRKVITALTYETSRLVGVDGDTSPLYKKLVAPLYESPTRATIEHSERVSNAYLELNRTFYRIPEPTTRLLGRLHDIGKGHTKDFLALLEGNTVLSESEFNEAKKHSIYSASALENEGLVNFARIIRGHHSWVKSGGYPEDYYETGFTATLSKGLAVSDKLAALREPRTNKYRANTICTSEETIGVLRKVFMDEVTPQINFFEMRLNDGKFNQSIANPFGEVRNMSFSSGSIRF